MSEQIPDVQMKWTKKLGEPLQKNRYAFYADLSPMPDYNWTKCFQEIVRSFNQTSPFDAAVFGSQAIVFGPLQAFENLLSKELEAAIDQTNQLYKRHLKQEANEKNQRAANWAAEEKIREELRKKFVKE